MTAVVTPPLDFESLAEELRRLVEEREAARVAVLGALRQLESRVVAMLGEETLRGLPNLAPPWFTAPYYGARVTYGEGVRWRGLPKTGESCLLVNKRGRIVRARVVGENRFEERVVADDEIRVEDLEPVSRAYVDAIERHAEQVGRSQARTRHALELAQSMSSLLAAAKK